MPSAAATLQTLQKLELTKLNVRAAASAAAATTIVTAQSTTAHYSVNVLDTGMRLFARLRPEIEIEQRLRPDSAAAGGPGYGIGDADGGGGSGGGGGSKQGRGTTLHGIDIVDESQPQGGTMRAVRVARGKAVCSYRVHDAFGPGVGQEQCYDQVCRRLHVLFVCVSVGG